MSRTPVEIWRGGDDSLRLRFAEALEVAFHASPEFSLSYGKQPGTLIVTVFSPLRWKQVGKRRQVSYEVIYSDVADRPLGRAKGKCWDDELEKCAAGVVKRATSVTRSLR